MSERKAFLLRIDPDLYDVLSRWAADDLRSLNGQIEYLLREATVQRGRASRRGREDGGTTPKRKTAMNMPKLECPACRVTMQEGFVVDTGHGGSIKLTTWHEGRPEKGRITGNLKVKKELRKFETATFRCPRCGWLIWFAPDTPRSATE